MFLFASGTLRFQSGTLWAVFVPGGVLEHARRNVFGPKRSLRRALFRGGPVKGEVLLHGDGEVRDADVLVVAVRDGNTPRPAYRLVRETRQVRRIAAEGYALGRKVFLSAKLVARESTEMRRK